MIFHVNNAWNFFVSKSTQIGKDVNNLRKLSKRIKEESRSLVQTWKQLLPPSKPSKPSQDRDMINNPALGPGTSSSKPPTYSSLSSIEQRRGMSSSCTGSDGTKTKHSSKPSRSKGSKARHMDTGIPSSKTASSKESKSLDDFTKALLGAPSNEDAQVDNFDSGFNGQESSHRTAHTARKETHREPHRRKQDKETYNSIEMRTNKRLASNSTIISNQSNTERTQAHTAKSTSNDLHSSSSSSRAISGSQSTTEDPTRKRKGEKLFCPSEMLYSLYALLLVTVMIVAVLCVEQRTFILFIEETDFSFLRTLWFNLMRFPSSFVLFQYMVEFVYILIQLMLVAAWTWSHCLNAPARRFTQGRSRTQVQKVSTY